MICAEQETLRQKCLAARADYQLALADLQVTTDVEEFRQALQSANQAFSDFQHAETALNRHLERHGCARAPVFLQPQRAAASRI